MVVIPTDLLEIAEITFSSHVVLNGSNTFRVANGLLQVFSSHVVLNGSNTSTYGGSTTIKFSSHVVLNDINFYFLFDNV